MKTFSLASFVPRALLLVPLAMLGPACDSAGGTGTVPDATTTPDTNSGTETTVADDTTVAPDTTPAEDSTPVETSAPDTGETTEPGGCDHEGFTAQLTGFEKESGSVVVEMRSSETTPLDVLQIEIYTFGDYQGATDVGTYSLAGSSYEDCANCVVVRANCTDTGCEKRFLVDEGDLVISQWDLAGGVFKGHLAGAKAHEVTIDSDTFVSTVVPGGETWCLDGVEFEAPIASLPVSDRTQPTCVADGTGNILGDNIANFSLNDCNGRRVKLHATCDDPTQKALWIIGTTGWCTACHEFLAGFVADHGGFLSRAKVGEVSKGLDMLIVLGEDGSGLKPTQAYCKAYAAELGIDPAMVLIDWSDTPVEVPIVNSPGMTIETNSLGTVWGAIDPYLYEEGGGVATYYPWWGLLRPRNMEYVWSDRAAVQSFEVTLLGLLAED